MQPGYKQLATDFGLRIVPIRALSRQGR